MRGSSKRRPSAIAIYLLAGGLFFAPAGCHAPEPEANMHAWVAQLEDADGNVRREASERLLDAGAAAAAALRLGDPGQPQVIHPRRAAVLLALIEDRLPPGASADGFGVSVEPGTLRGQVEAAGRDHGFVLKPGARFDPAARPACYVEVAPGHRLMAVLKQVMIGIPWVTTANFRLVEH